MPNDQKTAHAVKDAFLHELALLMLAETPIKSAVKRRTTSLRGEIVYRIKPENRELYLASRDVLLEFARTLANVTSLEQVSSALTCIQQLTTEKPEKR